MKEPTVADTTCLIGLERIGRLDILPALFEPVLIPPEVNREFGIVLPFLVVRGPSNIQLVSALLLLVDKGEAEAIALAAEAQCGIILDDSKARSVARNLGVSVRGTVGTLIKAKNSGVVQLIRPLVQDLETNGFYIDARLKAEALRLAGE